MVEDNLVELIGPVKYRAEGFYDSFGQYFETSMEEAIEFEILKFRFDTINLHVSNTVIRIEDG